MMKREEKGILSYQHIKAYEARRGIRIVLSSATTDPPDQVGPGGFGSRNALAALLAC